MWSSPVDVGIIFDGRSARFETLIPLVTMRTAQTVTSISLLQHLKSLRKVFPNLKQNFTQTRCSSRSFIFQLAKNRRGH
jgi:DNA/RNA-binding domain of Phe-tRNA-synthetase-like protein